jgi:hypothetical protein
MEGGNEIAIYLLQFVKRLNALHILILTIIAIFIYFLVEFLKFVLIPEDREPDPRDIRNLFGSHNNSRSDSIHNRRLNQEDQVYMRMQNIGRSTEAPRAKDQISSLTFRAYI